jgi:hypothetical protein
LRKLKGLVKYKWHSIPVVAMAILLSLSMIIGGTVYATSIQYATHKAINTWTLPLTSRDSTTWLPTSNASATIVIKNTATTILPIDAQGSAITTYSPYNIILSYRGLKARTSYSVIYYAEPWAGNGGWEIFQFKTSASSSGRISKTITSWQSIPCVTDANYDVGGKIWIVPSSDYSGGQMTSWNPANYLFDTGLVNIP